MDGLIIRNANNSDIDFLVRTIVEAEKSGSEVYPYSTVFKLSEEESMHYIRKAFEQDEDGSVLSVSSYMIAEINNVTAGALSAWVEGAHGASSAEIKANILRFVLPPRCIKSALEAYPITTQVHIDYIPGTIQIGAGYVDLKFRGNGILGKINDVIINRLLSENENVSGICAQIFDNNTSSIKTYLKAGFELVLEKTAENKEILEYLPSDKMILFVKKINKK